MPNLEYRKKHLLTNRVAEKKATLVKVNGS